MPVLNDDDRAVIGQQFHDLQPVIKIGVFFAHIGYQHVQRALGQKKLVGGVVNFLPAKIPDVHGKVFAVRTGK